MRRNLETVKKEEGCGVWSARNLDRVSGNEPRILLQPGRAEGGRGGERRGGSKPFSLAKRRRGDEAKRGGGGQVLSVYGELISGVRNQSLPEAVTIASRFPSSFLTLGRSIAPPPPPLLSSRDRKPPRFRAIRASERKKQRLRFSNRLNHRVREREREIGRLCLSLSPRLAVILAIN